MRDYREHSSSTEREPSRRSGRDPGKGPSVGTVQRKAAPAQSDAGESEAEVATAPAADGAGADYLIAHETAHVEPQAAPVQQKSGPPIQKKDDKEKNKHRGRIQVQGGGVEKSRPWTQDSPRTKADGLADLTSLKGELTKKQLKIRDEAFQKAEKFINDTLHTCPPDVHKTFQNREVIQANGDERVDVEILGGTAFA